MKHTDFYSRLITLLALCQSIYACAQSGEKQRPTASPKADISQDSLYTYRETGSEGTGKFYMGREIASVMGHQGAGWLERSEREKEEGTHVLIKSLGLKRGDVVADIGAGTGYYSFRIAEIVSQGRVLAVDIQPEMIHILYKSKKNRKENQPAAARVQPVLGTITDPKLPEGKVDLVLIVDAYHEFSHPREMMQQIARSLSAAGRVALVEYRAEDPHVPIKALHKMSQEQAVREMKAAGLVFIENKDLLPWQHLMFFRKAK
jgi:ubiquinone/menaquinone biosynthesis C-methylase UbiE